jgi:hypothetical protein
MCNLTCAWHKSESEEISKSLDSEIWLLMSSRVWSACGHMFTDSQVHSLQNDVVTQGSNAYYRDWLTYYTEISTTTSWPQRSIQPNFVSIQDSQSLSCRNCLLNAAIVGWWWPAISFGVINTCSKIQILKLARTYQLMKTR